MTWLVQDWPSLATQPQRSAAGPPGHTQTSSLLNSTGASSIPPAPPPPPLPPAAPPPSTEVPMQPSPQPAISASRGALLSSIQNFQKGTLKKTQTCDYSAPRISWGYWFHQDWIPLPLPVLSRNKPLLRGDIHQHRAANHAVAPFYPSFSFPWAAALHCGLHCHAKYSILLFGFKNFFL